MDVFILMLIFGWFWCFGGFRSTQNAPFHFSMFFLFSLRCAMLSPLIYNTMPWNTKVCTRTMPAILRLGLSNIIFVLCFLQSLFSNFPWLISSITPTHSLDARVTVFLQEAWVSGGIGGKWGAEDCKTHFPVNHDSGWTMSWADPNGVREMHMRGRHSIWWSWSVSLVCSAHCNWRVIHFSWLPLTHNSFSPSWW